MGWRAPRPQTQTGAALGLRGLPHPAVRTGEALMATKSGKQTMAARSVAWDTGEAIPGTDFRHMIMSAGTGGVFYAVLLSHGSGQDRHEARDR